jgi:protein SCO1/2
MITQKSSKRIGSGWPGLRRAYAIVAMVAAAVTIVAGVAEAQHGTRAVGVPLAPLSRLTLHTGIGFELQRLKGRPFIVAFGYTSCPDVCPTTLLELSNDLQSLGGDAARMEVLFVTVDPETDTVEQLRNYIASFDARILGLTGDPLEIEAVAHAFNAAYERVAKPDGSYTVDHTTRVYYFDKYGLLAGRHDILKEPAKRRHEMMRRLLAQ